MPVSVIDATSTGSTGTVMVSGNMPAFRAYLTANQTVTSGVATKVTLNAENFDTANCFDSTTNYRFTPNVAGYYQFNAMIGGNGLTTLSYNYIQIFKNGVSDSIAIYGPYLGTSNYGSLSTLIYLNGSTDYVELYGTVAGTGAMSFVGGAGAVSSYLSGFLARAA
jgi:hypothetical protein